MRRIGLLVILIALLSAFALPTFAGGASYHVCDRGGLLSDAEEVRLSEFAKVAYEQTGCGFYVDTHRLSRYDDDYYIGTEFLQRQRLSRRDDVILLIITYQDGTYYYDLYLYGNGEQMITQEEANVILDTPGVFYSIKGGELELGIRAFFDAAVSQYQNETVRPNPYLRALPVAAVISAVIALAACMGVKMRYAMKNKSVDYPLDRYAKLELTEKEDVFAGSFITKRTIQSSSGGGSGGGRGGGGGHAGGR